MPSVYIFNTQPVKNAIFTFLLMGLTSQADTDVFQTSVTLATGDVKVIGGTGTATNITTLPSEIGTTGVLIITLSASEMNHDQVGVLFHDASGSQWQDCGIWFSTVSAVTVSDFDETTDNVTVGSHTAASLAEFFTTDTLKNYSDAIDRSVVKEVLDGVPPSSVGAAAIWSYASRTLTMTLSQIINALTGTKLSIYRGDTNEINVVVGDISDYQQLDIFVKNDLEDRDDQAVFWIRKNLSGTADGLKALYDFEQTGGTIVPAWGSIAINNAATGDITFTLKADASQHLEPDAQLWYDIQKITATKVKTLTKGTAEVEADVGKAIT